MHNTKKHEHYSYWSTVWKQFSKHQLGVFALAIVLLFCLVGIYAPFLASSKPLVVYFEGEWYFPLFRYLFYRGFFTKRLDIFYNLLMFTLPLFILTWFSLKRYPYWRKLSLLVLLILHMALFLYLALRASDDPASNSVVNRNRQQQIQQTLKAEKENPLLASFLLPNWNREVQEMTPYAKLNLVLRYQQRKDQNKRLQPYADAYATIMKKNGFHNTLMPTLWNLDQENEKVEVRQQEQVLATLGSEYPKAKALIQQLNKHCQTGAFDRFVSPWMVCDFLVKLSTKDRQSLIQAKQTVKSYEFAQAQIQYLQQKREWLDQQASELQYEVMPLVRPFHWEDDAGGSQELNRHIGWWDLTRINRKDMVAALIFGVRISLSVGLTAVGLALLIGIPIGAIAGFYGGKTDIIIYRLIEIWESMPTFFMLLMIVAFLQNKSIFIVVAVIGFFGWTGFSRFVRGEFFKQKQLPYVEACRALGFNDSYIMFSHLLPNAIPPLLTLVPFAIMGAITSEAGLSFLGLGEEGSCSWGVLMDEGRSAFPAESYLLWPPAILLTIFLVSIALVGDALRDALDPKLHRV